MVYLLYGEEKYLLENSLSKLLKEFGEKINGINFINLDSTNVQNIISDIETPAFGYPRKLILVKDSQLFKKQSRGKKGASSGENENVSKIAEYIDENIESYTEMLDTFRKLGFSEEELDYFEIRDYNLEMDLEEQEYEQ